MVKDVKIIKRNGNKQDFDPDKIKVAIRKSAERALVTLTPEAEDEVVKLVLEYLDTQTGDAGVQVPLHPGGAGGYDRAGHLPEPGRALLHGH